MRAISRVIAGLLACLALAPAQAHKASDAYLQLVDGPDGIALRVDVALRDLDERLDLDRDGDARLTWGEVQAAWPAIDAEVRAGVRIEGCELAVAGRGLERRNDGAYAVLRLVSPCRPAGGAVVRYTLLRETDPTHRGILRHERPGEAPRVSLLDPNPGASIDTVARVDATSPSAEFVAEGVHHIVTGYDHVLFLLCLLLPSVMRRDRRTGRPAWRPVQGLGDALLPVAGIVTAFTLAHSVTLGLAALGWVQLPAAFIEPAIAVTIVLAAIDNLVPIFGGRRVLVTFAFGLIHGFGFAGVLGELDLPAGAFALALFQFNLGLELGQLAIVVVAAGLLYALRERAAYPRWVIGGGSAAAIAVGTAWFLERSFDLGLPAF